MDGSDAGHGGIDETLFEYACHEGNYSIVNVLSGERAAERAAEVETNR